MCEHRRPESALYDVFASSSSKNHERKDLLMPWVKQWERHVRHVKLLRAWPQTVSSE